MQTQSTEAVVEPQPPARIADTVWSTTASFWQIWLFRNRIGDEGALCLAALLKEVCTRNCERHLVGTDYCIQTATSALAASVRLVCSQSPEPIEELHLSHNLLTNQGAAQLLWSVDRCAAAFAFRRATAARARSRRYAVIRRSLTHAAFSLLWYPVPPGTLPVVCAALSGSASNAPSNPVQRKRRCTRSAHAQVSAARGGAAVAAARLQHARFGGAPAAVLCRGRSDQARCRSASRAQGESCRSCAQPSLPARTPSAGRLLSQSYTRAPAATLCMRLALV